MLLARSEGAQRPFEGTRCLARGSYLPLRFVSAHLGSPGREPSMHGSCGFTLGPSACSPTSNKQGSSILGGPLSNIPPRTWDTQRVPLLLETYRPEPSTWIGYSKIEPMSRSLTNLYGRFGKTKMRQTCPGGPSSAHV